MLGDDRQLIDDVVKLLGCVLLEEDDRGERIASGNGVDIGEQRRDRRSDLHVGEHLERVFHVGGGDSLSVVPARTRVEGKNNRERIRGPGPTLRQPWSEAGISYRRQIWSDLRQPIEDEILNDSTVEVVHERREQVDGV